LLPVITAAAISAAAVGPAAAEEAPGGSLYCGEIDRPAQTVTLQVVVVGGNCKDAKKVVREYFKAVDRGRCRTNSCRLTIRKHKCSANNSATFEDTGVAAQCSRGNRTITAEDR
jgi:hypothetical protein